MKNLFKTSLTLLTGLMGGLLIGVYAVSPKEQSFAGNNDRIQYEIAYNKFMPRTYQDTLKALQSVKDSIFKAHRIWYSKADSMQNNYLEYDKKWYNASLHTNEADSNGNDHLKSFFISKVLIDTLFAHKKDPDGIRLTMAKKRADNKKIFTFVISGSYMGDRAKPYGPLATSRRDTSGLQFDYVDTCPKNCN
ncbi:hypothetical protein [Mucilaginibacter glaciei]|uniref:Uncharacterized protein n=1 Tax=Mucilaginibacter glaciei TaxID=2772109 RepID=A0A926NK21_9SPHI|nr:hypothetical protein [Mucilaginibacter glaciei]MBD1393509.1 hypothetical protein [Mucilaginibacter glaciei]